MSRPTAGSVACEPIGLRTVLRTAWCLAALCSFPPVFVAQTPPPTPGARIRVVPTDADGYWAVEGRLLRLRPDTVTIDLRYPPGHTRAFALDGSWQVEVAGPAHRHVGRRVLWGAGFGAIAFGIMAAASYEPCVPHGFLDCMLAPGSVADAGARGAFGGGVLGGAVGLAIGLLVKDVEWTPVRTEAIRVGLAPLPTGRVRLGAAVAF